MALDGDTLPGWVDDLQSGHLAPPRRTETTMFIVTQSLIGVKCDLLVFEAVGRTWWLTPPLPQSSGTCLLLGRCCCGGGGGGRGRRTGLRVVDLTDELVDHVQLIGLHHEVLLRVVVVDLVVPGLRHGREVRDLRGVTGTPRRDQPERVDILGLLDRGRDGLTGDHVRCTELLYDFLEVIRRDPGP